MTHSRVLCRAPKLVQVTSLFAVASPREWNMQYLILLHASARRIIFFLICCNYMNYMKFLCGRIKMSCKTARLNQSIACRVIVSATCDARLQSWSHLISLRYAKSNTTQSESVAGERFYLSCLLVMYVCLLVCWLQRGRLLWLLIDVELNG